MPIAFENNVPAPWQNRLNAGYNAMPALIQTCVTKMRPGTIDWPLYRKWFDPQGNANAANVQFVRTVFNTLYDWRQGKTLRFFNATGNAIQVAAPGVCAYVWQLHEGLASGTAHVGSGLRVGIAAGMVAPMWTDADVAAILCHELTHKLGRQCGRNISDNAPAYGQIACLDKAANNTPSALTNADNYRCYIKEANRIAWIGDY